MTCEKCKYYDVDYEYDDDYEEETEVDTCRKGHEFYFVHKNICPDFQEYKPKKYIERDTRCDKCEFLSDCMKHYEFINCTTESDSRQHYIIGAGSNCKKMGGQKNEKLEITVDYRRNSVGSNFGVRVWGAVITE